MLGSPQPRVAPTSSSTMTPTSANGGLSPGIANNSTLSAFLPPRLPIFWFTVKVYRLILRFFPRLTDANIISEPIMSMDRGTNSSWRPRPGPPIGSNGYGSGMVTGVETGGYGAAPGKRGATAAQFVGGAWNGMSVGWGSNPGSRNVTPTGYATPPLGSYTPTPPSEAPTFNAAQDWSSPPVRNIPPPPKGAGKKKD